MKDGQDQAIANFLKSAANGLQLLGESLNHLAKAMEETDPVDSKPKRNKSTINPKTDKVKSTKRTKKDKPTQKPNNAKLSQNAQTEIDLVLNLVEKAQTGINFEELLNQTGFEKKTLKSIIFNLIKDALIDTLSGGYYVKRN